MLEEILSLNLFGFFLIFARLEGDAEPHHRLAALNR